MLGHPLEVPCVRERSVLLEERRVRRDRAGKVAALVQLPRLPELLLVMVRSIRPARSGAPPREPAMGKLHDAVIARLARDDEFALERVVEPQAFGIEHVHAHVVLARQEREVSRLTAHANRVRATRAGT